MVSAALASMSSDDVTQIILWCTVLILAIVVLFLGVWYYRRRWIETSAGSSDQTPWTLDDLRNMKEAGQLSEEEYQALRASMIAAFRPKGPKETSPGTGTGPTDPREKGSDFDLRNGPSA